MKLFRALFYISVLSLSAAIAATGATPYEGRTVSRNSVFSPRDPRARVVLPAQAAYVGSDHWVLFGIANCDLYAFVRADRAKNVQALYWVQFEGYIPSMPALQHRYDSPRHATMGGLDFYVDTWTESNPHGVRPPNTNALEAAIRAKGYAVPSGIHTGSDEQHLYALLERKGYRMPVNLMGVRFVHLVDSQKRKELMIIYSEPLSVSTKSTLVRRAEELIRIETLQPG